MTGAARNDLTGILLIGGASLRFGSPKALAQLDGETLAERAWRTLEICQFRIAVGKTARAAIIGVAAGLRAAPTDLCVVLPVDCPEMTAEGILALVEGCRERDVAVPQTGPLPGVYRKRALAALESGERAIHRAIERLNVAVVTLDPALLANTNTPTGLQRLGLRSRDPAGDGAVTPAA